MKTFSYASKITVSMLVMIVLLCGLGGVSYAADPPAAELQVETEQALTETNLDGHNVTLKLIGGTWTDSVTSIKNALTVSGIEDVTFRKGYRTATYREFVPFDWTCVGLCPGRYVTRGGNWIEQVTRVDDNTVTIALKFDGDFDTDAILTFTVEAAAIENYDGPALTAEVPVTSYKGVSVSVTSPLTEATLDGSVATLALTGGIIYDPDISKINSAVTIAGIDGVTSKIQRLSGTEITVALAFDSTDFDTDTALTFSVGAGAIANYTGDALTTEISVTAYKESLLASVVSPLTEATLDAGTVTLILRGAAFEQDNSKIKDALAISGINGVTIDTDTLQRLSDRRVSVQLAYDGTDFDTDSSLTFTIISEAIANHNGKLTTEIPVTAIVEVVSASVVSPLTEETLDGSIVTLKLTGIDYEQDISKISDAVTVSGIDGVTIDTTSVQRLGDQIVSVELDYDDTDFVRETALTFSIAAGAITDHNSTALTAELLVTASRNEDILTIVWTDAGTDKIQRANLDGSNIEDLVTQGLDGPSSIALDVAGGKMYWIDNGTDKIQRANLDGSHIEDLVKVQYNYYGGLRHVALDVEGGKMYWTEYTVFATDRRMYRIRRANLDGSNIEGLVTIQPNSYIRGSAPGGPAGIALDVEGGKMYWTDLRTDKIQRANLDGSNIEDLVTQGLRSPGGGIALDVEGGKMYWTDLGSHSYWRSPKKIQRANLDGSNIEDLVTQGLEYPRGITLDVEGGKMYWTDNGTDKIQRANLDGSNIEDLVTQGLSSPLGIALGVLPSVGAPPDTPAPVTRKEDVNGDGVVDVQDLVNVAQEYGKTGTNTADVNGDEVVDVDDFILVAAAVDTAAAAAPAARAQVHSHFTAAQLQGWLTEARASRNTSHTYQKGIAVLEQLLALVAPEETALLANYPNPFNPETWIPYQLSKSADVSLTIYDIQGRVVRALDLGHQRAGMYQIRSRAAYWDGRNAVGEPVASGVYFYTLSTESTRDSVTAGDFSATRKMLIRK